MLLALVCAAIPAGLLSELFGGSSVVMGVVFWPLFIVLWYAIAATNVLYCPRCGKRVKLGHDTCHHCGATVA
jgi:hypothetical protein